MASSEKNLQSLPIELVQNIANRLSRRDVLAYRTTCSRIMNKTFTMLVPCFKSLANTSNGPPVSSLVRVLDSTQLASAVHVLVISFGKGRNLLKIDSVHPTTTWNDFVNEMGQVLGKLPKLKPLYLRYTDSEALARYMRLSERSAVMHCTTVPAAGERTELCKDEVPAPTDQPTATFQLYDCTLSSSELSSLITALAARGTLRALAICKVHNTDGDWNSVFSTIKSLHLEGVDFSELKVGEHGSYRVFTERNNRVTKGMGVLRAGSFGTRYVIFRSV